MLCEEARVLGKRSRGQNWIAKITGLGKKYGCKREVLRTVSKIISRLEK